MGPKCSRSKYGSTQKHLIPSVKYSGDSVLLPRHYCLHTRQIPGANRGSDFCPSLPLKSTQNGEINPSSVCCGCSSPLPVQLKTPDSASIRKSKEKTHKLPRDLETVCAEERSVFSGQTQCWAAGRNGFTWNSKSSLSAE